jgi:HEAT repeat protein
MSNPLADRRLFGRRRPGPLAVALLLAVAVWSAPRVRARQQTQTVRDPVEDFRSALKSESSTTTNAEIIKARDANLKAKAEKLNHLGDISRALLFKTEWRADLEDPRLKVISDEMLKVDSEVREELTKKMDALVTAVFAGHDPAAKVAAAQLIGETAVGARDLPGIRGLYLRRFIKDKLAPKLMALIDKSPSADVKEAGLLSLGKVEPAIIDAVPVLTKALHSDKVGVRRAAAHALADLVAVADQANQLIKKTGNFAASEENRKELVKVAANGVKLAMEGFNDPDAEVRRACTEACANAGAVLVRQIDDREKSLGPDYTKRYPPKEREKYVTPEERVLINRDRQVVEGLRELIKDLLKAFADPVGKTTPIASLARLGSYDPDLNVRLLARRALEQVGSARQNYLRLARSIPVLEGEKPLVDDTDKEAALPRGPERLEFPVVRGPNSEPVDTHAVAILVGRPVAYQPPPTQPEKELGDDLKRSLDTIIAGLADKDVRARLAALDLLESMRHDGAAALPALLKVLGDQDKFVRWAAARCVGRLAPLQPGLVIPKLIDRLKETDIDVRIAVLSSLEQYGVYADFSPPETKQAITKALKAAVPYLGNLVMKGDAESRIAAMRVLEAIGENALPALPALAKDLDDAEPRVRIAAANTLGQFTALKGKDLAGVQKALRKALDDDNPDVRRAVSAALLRVDGK